MKSCKDIAKLLSPEGGELGFINKLEIRFHMLICKMCRRYRSQLSLLSKYHKQYIDELAKKRKEEIKSIEDKAIESL